MRSICWLTACAFSIGVASAIACNQGGTNGAGGHGATSRASGGTRVGTTSGTSSSDHASSSGTYGMDGGTPRTVDGGSSDGGSSDGGFAFDDAGGR
jgi:hypothetical protein